MDIEARVALKERTDSAKSTEFIEMIMPINKKIFEEVESLANEKSMTLEEKYEVIDGIIKVLNNKLIWLKKDIWNRDEKITSSPIISEDIDTNDNEYEVGELDKGELTIANQLRDTRLNRVNFGDKLEKSIGVSVELQSKILKLSKGNNAEIIKNGEMSIKLAQYLLTICERFNEKQTDFTIEQIVNDAIRSVYESEYSDKAINLEEISEIEVDEEVSNKIKIIVEWVNNSINDIGYNTEQIEALFEDCLYAVRRRVNKLISKH